MPPKPRVRGRRRGRSEKISNRTPSTLPAMPQWRRILADRFGEEWTSKPTPMRTARVTITNLTDQPNRVRIGLTCRQPDRDEPRIVCGYPLPCPHHTAVLVAGGAGIAPYFPPSLTDVRAVERLMTIGAALRERGLPAGSTKSWRRGIWIRG
jgi:hypothetical protein